MRSAVLHCCVLGALVGLLACGGADDAVSTTPLEALDAGADARPSPSYDGGPEQQRDATAADAGPIPDPPIEVCNDTTTTPVPIHTVQAFTLAVAHGNVYWSKIGGGVYASDGEVGVVSRCATFSKTLASSQIAPYALAAAHLGVCWANLGNTVDGNYAGNGAVYCLGPAGGTTLMQGYPRPSSVVTDGTAAFWAGEGSVFGTASIGTGPTSLGSGGAVLGLDANSVYVEEGGSLFSMPRSGGPRHLLVSGVNPSGSAAVGATDVYLSGYTEDDGGARTGVYRVAKGGGPAVLLAETTQPGNQIGADATHVYFSDALGVRRVPVGGGPIETLDPSGAKYALAVDDTYVFWGTGGVILRLRKPS